MKALVTGGGGFLGSAVVRGLLERAWEVRSFSRGHYPALDDLGVEQDRGNLADAAAVHRAADGCEIVFHVAAKAGVWGDEKEYHSCNVIGTKNVVEACRAHGIAKLVFTSSPSVIHAGGDVEGVDESAPYPEHFDAPYPKTKAAAERMVLAANDAELATVALRPHLIWGPGDTHLGPQMIARQRQGSLRLVGGGLKLVDSVFIDNAAEAHLLAAERLEPGAACAGRAYFISQGQPTTIAELINGILAAAGLGPVRRSISPRAAYAAGWVLEHVHKLLRLSGEPRMTRFIARQLATAHWYDISAARRDLNYAPEVSLEAGFERLREWCRGPGLESGQS